MAEDAKRDRTAGDDRPNLLGEPLAMFCLGCRYPLRGLTGGACPECGRGFDPADPATYSPTAKRWSWVLPIEGWCALLFASPMGALLLQTWMGPGWRWWGRRGDDVGAAVFLLSMLALAVWLGIQVSSRRWRSIGDLSLGMLLSAGLVWVGLLGGGLVPLYGLSMSCALCLVMSWRAWWAEAWYSRQLAGVAAVVNVLGLSLLITEIPSGLREVYDYWTYWFWTPVWY